ncbi:MAG: hypothetical protein MUO54_14655 [Anaerolineales bacterium]|nr:hypothetical protein [Anaerolineales bacterium]
MQIPPMELQLVIDAIWDQNPNAQELSNRLTAVNENFIEKVSSITPQPPTFTPSPNTQIPGTSQLPDSPTTTLLSSPTKTLTLPTNTSSPPTKTNAPGAPTNTALPPSSTPMATDTDVPPTDTDMPPTNTPIPPSATTSPCSEISLSWYGYTESRIGWTLDNSGNTVVVISSVQIFWPASNNELELMSLDGDTFWTGNISPPSATISSGWAGGVSRRSITPFHAEILRLWFDDTSQSSGYSVTVEFNNGCSESASH